MKQIYHICLFLLWAGMAEAQTSTELPARLFAFGHGGYGQLGTGNTNSRNTPVPTGADSDWIQVSAGLIHSLAIKSDGTLRAWGNGTGGRLGTGNTDSQNSPVQVGTATNWVQASAGYAHSLAVKSDGTLWAWGFGADGRLGTGNTDIQFTPVQIGTATGWKQVSAGGAHSLAVKSDGTLWAWGMGFDGQLGTGDTGDEHSPVQIGSATNWKEVSAGNLYSLAIKSDGTLWAWGNGKNAKLGTGNTGNQNSPVQIGTATNWKQVSAGDLHSLAVKSDGTLWAWGYGGSGRLGTGNVEQQNSPFQVGTATNWVQVSAGEYHSLAVKSDGTLLAWGYGVDGRLGTGNTGDQNSPVQIGMGTYSFASAGGRHSLVLGNIATYDVALTAGPGAGGTVSGAGTYDLGTNITVTATANTAYTFINWTENGTEVSTNASYSFTVDADRDLAANFILTPAYDITLTASPGEGGTVSGAGTYDIETDITVTATANTGYLFTNWTENGTEVSADASYNFTVDADRDLVANFTLITPDADNIFYVDINVPTGGNGSGDSWANAIPQLADALKWARQQDNFTAVDPLKIYVAKGTYKPMYNAADNYYTTTGSATTGYTDNDNAFVMVNNVQVYGGFDPAGDIDDLNDTRDYTSTILSGDIGAAGTVYHVVIAAGDIGSALLNGFTVTGVNSTVTSIAGYMIVNSLLISRFSGGGMFNHSSSPAIVNCSFTGNVTSNYGGGMFNHSSSPAITNCSFTGNTTRDYGGGIYNSASSPTVTNCSFAGNSAFYGGGMYNYESSSVTVINCSFTGNTADSGGGMQSYNSSPVITRCSFTENRAESTDPSGGNGGAMNNNYSSPAITDCSFTENSATRGGAMFNRGESPIITDCRFTGNTASNSGGAMYNNEASPTITNSGLTGNSAFYSGGMYNNEASPTITNTTIAGNGSNGFYITGPASNPVFGNSIVWDAITVYSDGSYTASYSLIKGSSSTADGNINADLYTDTDIFTDPANGDYTLKSGSPAINAGSNDLFPGLDDARDLAGSPRLTGDDIDMGAYESPDGGLPVRWISFEGRLSDQRRAVLTWKTEETNVSRYEAERSANGWDFRIAGKVAAGGTGSGSYSLTDPAPVSGTVYYRIRQVDFDGTFSYSRIISLTCTGRSNFFAYPNPVKDNVMIELGTEYIGSKVKLVSAAGIILQQAEVKEEQLTLDVSRYASGVYLLQTHDGKVLKLIKE